MATASLTIPGTGVTPSSTYRIPEMLAAKVPEVVKSKISELTSDIMSGRIVVPERNLPIS